MVILHIRQHVPSVIPRAAGAPPVCAECAEARFPCRFPVQEAKKVQENRFLNGSCWNLEITCTLCPRRCGAPRGDDTPGGLCRSPLLPRVARAAPHYGEEPCIAGKNGTGRALLRILHKPRALPLRAE